ncbi:hypothetical protein MYP_399 [Sporocytophaga myxococcoides]|uniref:Uncharacterized protein n=1 Tax=Sporocytophaga myxococcoides TaxID=153721 RepID=A0A098L9Z9_9BACT|nr:hypothetical protein MYP_399 [Sporocytophaga myxococcoides]
MTNSGLFANKHIPKGFGGGGFGKPHAHSNDCDIVAGVGVHGTNVLSIVDSYIFS